MTPSPEKDDTSSEIYILRLTVKSATELPVCDCYVKVKVGSIHKKTPVREQCGEPTWNYTLEFFVNNTELKATLQVADKDPFKQEILGQATLDMTSLPLDTEKSHKLRLRGPGGGKLNSSMIVMTLIEKTDRKTATNLMKKRANTFSKKDLRRFSFRAKDSISTLKQKSRKPLATLKKSGSFFKSSPTLSNRNDVDSFESEGLPSKTPPKYRLYVIFHEAGRLTGRNSKQTFDTYCKLRVGDAENKTNIIRKEASPKFNETFNFDLADISEPLRIKIFQVNRLFDEVLGNAKLRLSELPFDTDLNINEFPLMTDEARFKCWNPYISLGIKLSCLASKLSEDEFQQQTESPYSMDKRITPSPPPVVYRVIVNMFRGKALLAKDESGLSDPYVILRIGDDQQATGVIYHSLAPMWNESFFFNVNDLNRDLQLTVADKDPEFDDFIGHYKLKLSEVPINQRCEFDIELSDESGRLEFSLLVQHEEDPQIDFIPYRSYSDAPIAQLFIKPVGLAQSEKNSARQNYRLEIQMGQETYSIFYEGPGCGGWGAIDIYDEYLEMVKFNLYLIRYGLQEELMSELEVDMSMHGSTSTNHETMDMPQISNMFLFCFNIKYKSYNTGVFLAGPEYDEEKSCEEMTFDELGDALTCPYNYALCIDSIVFESNGVFGNDELIAVIDTERIMLKTDATKITDNELHCGFIYRVETMPRVLSLKLFKQHKNFCVFIGSTEFSITKDSDGVLKSRMSLDNDGSILHIALFYDLIQHIHQDLINAVTVPKVPVLKPDADEITLLNNFKKLTYCFVTLSIFIKQMSGIRRMGSWKKLVLYILSITMVLYIPPEYTELTIPAFISIFILLISFRIIWKRKELSDMRLSVLEEISSCNVEEKIFVRTCDNAVNRINLTLQRFIYILSWNSPVQSMTSLIKLITVATIAAILPSQLLFLTIFAIILSHRTMFEESVKEIIDFLNPLNGVPCNICS